MGFWVEIYNKLIAVKAKTDNLPASPAAQAKLDTLHDTRIPGTIQPQTGDSYARLGAPAGASVSADVAAVKSDTGTLATRVPGTVQPQTGDSYARLGAPAGASVSADIAAGKAKIDTLHDTRIPGVVQPQTGDSYARLGAPAGASVSADVATANSRIGTGSDSAGADTVRGKIRQIIDSYLADATIGLSAIKTAVNNAVTQATNAASNTSGLVPSRLDANVSSRAKPFTRSSVGTWKIGVGASFVEWTSGFAEDRWLTHVTVIPDGNSTHTYLRVATGGAGSESEIAQIPIRGGSGIQCISIPGGIFLPASTRISFAFLSTSPQTSGDIGPMASW